MPIFIIRIYPIKQLSILFGEDILINAVGDPVSCTIRDYSEHGGRDTGPIRKGASGGGSWDCVWYNWQAKKLILTKVEIEYMDGSALNIEGDELYLIGKKKDK